MLIVSVSPCLCCPSPFCREWVPFFFLPSSPHADPLSSASPMTCTSCPSPGSLSTTSDLCSQTMNQSQNSTVTALPSSELLLSRRVPTEGELSSHSCSAVLVPSLGHADVQILGGLRACRPSVTPRPQTSLCLPSYMTLLTILFLHRPCCYSVWINLSGRECLNG